jgi:hypothetical protein
MVNSTCEPLIANLDTPPRRPAAGSGIILGWTAPKLRPAGDRPRDVLHVSKVKRNMPVESPKFDATLRDLRQIRGVTGDLEIRIATRRR